MAASRMAALQYLCNSCIAKYWFSHENVEWKKNYQQVYLEKCKDWVKKKKMPKLIDTKLEPDYDSDQLYLSAHWWAF